jgi:hypothetical protein
MGKVQAQFPDDQVVGIALPLDAIEDVVGAGVDGIARMFGDMAV